MYDNNSNFNPQGLSNNDPLLAKAKGKQMRKGNSPMAQDTAVNPFNQYDSAASGLAKERFGSYQDMSPVGSGIKPLANGKIPAKRLPKLGSKQAQGIDVDRSNVNQNQNVTNYPKKDERLGY